MKEADIRRYAWLLLTVCGAREAPRVAARLREALARIGDPNDLPTPEQVAQAIMDPEPPSVSARDAD